MTRTALVFSLALAWLLAAPGCLSTFDREWGDDDDDASDDDASDDDSAGDDDTGDDDGGDDDTMGDDDASDDDGGDDDTLPNQYCPDDGVYTGSITDVPLNECGVSVASPFNITLSDSFTLEVVNCVATVHATFAIDGMTLWLGEKGGDVILYAEHYNDMQPGHGVDCVLRHELTGFGSLLNPNHFSYSIINEVLIDSGSECMTLMGPSEVVGALPCNMLFQGSVQ